ncbi:DUF2855 family protein [Ramlibacter sp. PS4R-6]|uniref:DUF2855 family protein n=1 Tax=Ramlibacter sp. PS4R-6 TaxID=3133438 RepID=UPI0030AEAACD
MPQTLLLVKQDRLAESKLITREDPRLGPNEVRVRIDSFALTANNITYAAYGDSMSYWRFFPSGEEGWGVVPVWGFGTVVQSTHPGVAAGERLYGYWPMADSAVLQPVGLTPSRFNDGAAHRAELPGVYNQYVRTAGDSSFTPGSEDIQSLLRPLFTTSFLIDDFLADSAFFGADTVMLSSASSKTAYGTAFLLAQREGVQVVGLTSASNKAFCESLGCYSRVVTYDDFAAIAADTAGVYVDFAGDAPFRRKLHAHLPQLKYSCAVGGTHIDSLGGAKDLTGPKPVFFFAPAHGKKRFADWGPQEYQRRFGRAWTSFLARVQDSRAPWLSVHRHRGPHAAQSAYEQMFAGRADPREGQILSLA